MLLIFIIIFITIGVSYYYIIADNDSVLQYNEDGSQVVYCDGDGNRYNTEADAKAAGLSEAEYSIVFCSEFESGIGVYRGLSVTQAEETAAARGEMFRVVEIDGEPQPTTRDFQEGRINATVEGGVVTSYTVESNDPVLEADTETEANTNDEIIGMTTTEAEAYAEAQGVDFRTGTIDGEPLPVTLDLQPGRITAEIENGVVVGYTVE